MLFIFGCNITECNVQFCVFSNFEIFLNCIRTGVEMYGDNCPLDDVRQGAESLIRRYFQGQDQNINRWMNCPGRVFLELYLKIKKNYIEHILFHLKLKSSIEERHFNCLCIQYAISLSLKQVEYIKRSNI